MLKYIKDKTGGESTDLNIALCKNNAAFGAKIAVAMSQMEKEDL